MDIQFSLFEGINTNPIGDIDADLMYKYIVEGKLPAMSNIQTRTLTLQQEYAQNGKSKRYTEMKKQMPGFTAAGIFTYRNAVSLHQYSNCYCVDIDGISTQEIKMIKDDAEKLENCLMYFTSCSGAGVKILFRVNCNLNKIDGYTYITNYYDKYYKKQGIQIDLQCKDLGRLQFITFDKNAYFNKAATLLHLKFNLDNGKVSRIKPLATQIPADYYGEYTQITVKSQQQILDLISIYLAQNKLCITDDYDKWIRICFYLKNTFDTTLAFNYFDAFSKGFKAYDKTTVQDKFNNLKENKLTHNKITIATVVYYAEQIGFDMTSPRGRGVINPFTIRFKQGIVKAKLIANGIKLRNNLSKNKLEKYNWNKKIWVNWTNADLKHLTYEILAQIFRANIVKDLIEAFSPEIIPENIFLPKCRNEYAKNPNFDYLLEFTKTLYPSNLTIAEMFIKKWCIGLVRCLKTGQFNENMIVLVGVDNIGKTTWTNNLLPQEYQKDFFITKNLKDNKDDNLLMSEKWIIFNDELSTLITTKDNDEHFKALSSTNKITERRVWDFYSDDNIRKASLIAATNDFNFIKDKAVSRRLFTIEPHLPDNINHINGYHTINLYAMYGQALHLYENENWTHYLQPSDYETTQQWNRQYIQEDNIVWCIRNYCEQSNQFNYTSTQLVQKFNNLPGIREQIRINMNAHVGRKLQLLGYKCDRLRQYNIKFKKEYTTTKNYNFSTTQNETYNN